MASILEIADQLADFRRELDRHLVRPLLDRLIPSQAVRLRVGEIEYIAHPDLAPGEAFAVSPRKTLADGSSEPIEEWAKRCAKITGLEEP